MIWQDNDRKVKTRRTLVFGVGTNDADYVVTYRVNGGLATCPYYSAWIQMFRRCYDKEHHKKAPSYAGCIVSPKWHKFMDFRAWMMDQDWENNELDKDIRIPGNKIYGPESACFVSREVNSLISSGNRGEFPSGVSTDGRKNKFISRISTKGKVYALGTFASIDEAEFVYLKEKAAYMGEVAQRHPDKKVRDGLKNHVNLIERRINDLSKRGIMACKKSPKKNRPNKKELYYGAAKEIGVSFSTINRWQSNGKIFRGEME